MNWSFTTIIITAILGVALVASHGCYQYEETKREAMKAGLIQKQNPGSMEVIWTRAE